MSYHNRNSNRKSKKKLGFSSNCTPKTVKLANPYRNYVDLITASDFGLTAYEFHETCEQIRDFDFDFEAYSKFYFDWEKENHKRYLNDSRYRAKFDGAIKALIKAARLYFANGGEA